MNDDLRPEDAGLPEAPGSSPYGTKGLERYLDTNRGRFTDEALIAAASAAGWDESVIGTAFEASRGRTASAPIRARARRITQFLYLAGYVVLVAGMILNPAAQAYGGAVIGTVVLTVAMLVAFALGRLWYNRKGVSRAMSGADLSVLLVVPVILWLVVAGICVATGLPVPRTI